MSHLNQVACGGDKAECRSIVRNDLLVANGIEVGVVLGHDDKITS